MKSKVKSVVFRLHSLIHGNVGSGLYLINGHYFDSQICGFSNADLISEIANINSYGKLESWNFSDSHLMNYGLKPPKIKSFAFSFDDGFKEVSDLIVPAFDFFNIKVGIFIVPSFVGQNTSVASINFKLHSNKFREFMTWEDIKNLADRGHIIGNHTLSHSNLVLLSRRELEYEIQKSKEIIETNTNQLCDDFAIPYGRREFYSDSVLKVILKFHRRVFTSDRSRSYKQVGFESVYNRCHFEIGHSLESLQYFTRYDLK
jgi:peptidoglycan/xylan/chitin deacetylase (PgdA/CDA1 family)